MRRLMAGLFLFVICEWYPCDQNSPNRAGLEGGSPWKDLRREALEYCRRGSRNGKEAIAALLRGHPRLNIIDRSNTLGMARDGS